MKAMQFKYIVVACLLALTVSSQSFAVDDAEAAGVMTDLESLVTEAQRIISAEASNLDLAATDEAIPRSVAIDKEVEAGREALAAMEEAVLNGDNAAAEAAEDDLAAALRRARDLLAGGLPAPAATSDEQSQDDSVAGPVSDWDAPNIYDVPWRTQGIRAYYDSLFASFQDSESFGKTAGAGGIEDFDPDDNDATPE